jgi:hypothetical protein
MVLQIPNQDLDPLCIFHAQLIKKFQASLPGSVVLALGGHRASTRDCLPSGLLSKQAVMDQVLQQRVLALEAIADLGEL